MNSWVTVLVAVIGSGALSTLINQIFSRRDRKSRDTEAIRILLKKEIREDGNAIIARGSITSMELEEIIKAHECYKGLGGNGYLDNLMAKIKSLPYAD